MSNTILEIESWRLADESDFFWSLHYNFFWSLHYVHFIVIYTTVFVFVHIRLLITWISRPFWTWLARQWPTWSREKLQRRSGRHSTSRMTSQQRKKRKSGERTSGLLNRVSAGRISKAANKSLIGAKRGSSDSFESWWSVRLPLPGLLLDNFLVFLTLFCTVMHFNWTRPIHII